MENKFKQFLSWVTSDHLLFILAILLVILNFFDAGLSWFLIFQLKIAVEANPIMAFLMEQGIAWFFFYKLIIMPILVYSLYKMRYHAMAKIAIIFGFILFFVVVAYSGISCLWFFIL